MGVNMKKEKNKIHIIINILSIMFSLLLIFGNSYNEVGNASLIFKDSFSILKYIFIFITFIFIFRFLIYFFYKSIDKFNIYEIKESDNKFIKLFNKKSFLISFIIMIICWLPYIISFYPVILSPDPSFQIKQFFGIDNKYSTYVNLIDPDVIITNHHPVIHTLLLGGCLNIGHILGNDNLGLFIYSLIQILVLSSVLSYTIRYMNKLNIRFGIKFVFLLIYSLVPMFPFYAMSAVKDVIFTSLVIIYMIFIYDILKTKKSLTNKQVIYSLILLILIVLFRNNGIHMIVLSFPLLLVFCKNNFKKLLFILVFVLAFNISYNKIILPGFKITQGSVREKLSIPFQQTARFVKYDYKLLTNDEIDKIDKVLGIEDLANRYKPNISDPVKNGFNKDTTREELNDYFKVWLNGLLKDPVLYVDATINNTYGYFYPFTDNWYIYHRYNDTIVEDGFNYQYIDNFSQERKKLKKYGINYPKILFIGKISNIGFNVWLLFLLLGYLVYKNKSKGIIILSASLSLLLVCVASPVNTYFRYAMPYIFGMPITICMVLDYIKRGVKNE